MRRILLLATVALMMATMLGVTAGPASATIHSISCGDHAKDGNPVLEEESPPGISDDDEDAVVDNGTNAIERQPVLSVRDDAPDESQGNENARDGEKLEHCERN